MNVETAIPELLARDALADAEAAAVARVKAAPSDARARLLLADLALLAGNLERADLQLSFAADLVPEDAVGVGLLRTQLRGVDARARWFSEGAVPVCPKGPTAADEAALRLGLALRTEDGPGAAAALEALEAARGERPGQWNGAPVDDLRDLDDRFGHAIEAISSGGDYMWIDLVHLSRIEFEAPQRIRDLALRKARLTLTDGGAADVLVPALYPAPTSEAEKLGRVTEWHDAPGGLTIGSGQRAWLVGDEMQGIMDATTIDIVAARDTVADV